MRLSELVERCKDTDPVLMVTGEGGIPTPVVEIDEGFTVYWDEAGRHGDQYVELLPADDEWDGES